MRILFATGGTAGHINPALAVASFIRETQKDSEILFIGTSDHMEARLVPNAGFDFKTIDIYQIGATIGVHTGPHPLGLGLLKKYDK